MDCCQFVKTSSPQWIFSSLKRIAAQDQSAENTNPDPQEEEESCCMPSQNSVSPPPSPPPPPPLPPLILKKVPVSTSKTDQKFLCYVADTLVPEEVVERWDKLFFDGNGSDLSISTDDGGSFQAHSIILVSASSIFKYLIEQRRSRKGKRVIRLIIPGVPLAAAKAFVRLMYSSRYHVSDMENYVLHLLVLSHAYAVNFVKKLCTEELEKGLLTVENVVDVFQLARLCDAPRLMMICFRLIINDFKAVAKTEGWRVMREANPLLEQELVGAVVDADSKRQERIHKIEEEKVYGQLRDAMEALVHICRDGCQTIGPLDKPFDEKQSKPCKFPACKGLESLVRHFARCKIKVPGGCMPCKRMWQLLELHSRMCQETENCKVPLCRHFKVKLAQQSKKDDNKWKVLVSKVTSSKCKMNSFSLAIVSTRLEEEQQSS